MTTPTAANNGQGSANQRTKVSSKYLEEEIELKQAKYETKIEAVLEETGGFGLHQFIVALAAGLCDISV